MSTTRLPELPLISMEDCLPYDLIRYIPGYPTEFVRQYANSYGLAVWKAAMEAAAQAVTIAGGGPWTNPRNPAAVIRSLPLPEQGSPQ